LVLPLHWEIMHKREILLVLALLRISLNGYIQWKIPIRLKPLDYVGLAFIPMKFHYSKIELECRANLIPTQPNSKLSKGLVLLV